MCRRLVSDDINMEASQPKVRAFDVNMKIVKTSAQTPWSTRQKRVFIFNILIIITSIVVVIIMSSRMPHKFLGIFENKEDSTGGESKTDKIYRQTFECVNSVLKTTTRHYGQYWIIENYIIGQLYKSVYCGNYVTYSTHIYNFSDFTNLPELAFRWNGPISVSVYTAATDFDLFMNAIQYARNCLPRSDIVKKSVSFHMIFPHNLLPNKIPHGHEIELWPFDCIIPPPYLRVPYNETYVFKYNVPYPINVLRNVARRTINTFYHLSAEPYLLPKVNASLHLMFTLYKKYCVITKQYLHCDYIHGQEDLMRQMHLLPKSIRNIETIYPLTLAEINPRLPIPERKVDVKVAVENGDITFMNVYYFVANPQVPYYDERIYWINDTLNQMQPYIHCLLDFQWEPMTDQYLWKLSDYKIPNYPTNQEFITAAQYLNKSILKMEYENIYGSTFLNECQRCYETDTPCF